MQHLQKRLKFKQDQYLLEIHVRICLLTLKNPQMQPLKVQRSPLGINNLLNSKKPSHSYFEEQVSLNQENIKGLQLIETKTRQIREKEKRDRDILKKFRKIFEDQVKKFQQLQKVSSQALHQKSRELELLSIQNTQLKDERVELQTAKEEKQLLSLQYEQLEKEIVSLKDQIAEMTQKYNELKVNFDQKSELLQNGIQNSKIETEESSMRNIPGSMKEIEQFNNELQAQKRKQIKEAIAIEEEKLTSKSLEISAILETFLQSVSNPYKGLSENKQVKKDTQVSDKTKLESLTEELKRKSDEISQIIENSNQLEINLRDRETDILRLSLNLKDQQQKIKEKDNSILALKKELQIVEEKEVNRMIAKETKRENQMKSFQTLQQDVTDLLKTKTLEQYKGFYDLLIRTTTQIFTTLKISLLQPTSTLPSNIMIILDRNMIDLNDFFADISKQQNEKTRRINQYISKAKNITEKRFSFEEPSDLERDLLASTPDRYGGIRDYQRKWEGSEDSGKSEKRGSVLLSNQMGTTNNYEEFMEQLKNQAFQQEQMQHDLTNSQIILDNLKEGNSMDFSTIQGGLNDSISNSQISTYSQAEQTLAHNEKKKSVILNAKLKRKKKT